MNKIIDIELKQTYQLPNCGPDFAEVLNQHKLKLARTKLNELQINLGRLCNQSCQHCHVDAGPLRTEIMDWPTMQRILDWVKKANINRVDLTGGAPELNPYFRKFCDHLLKQGIEITSRCNITVLYQPEQEDLAQWYANKKIRLVCSLPCYSKDNVDAQRGKGTFDKSIAGLQQLNGLGYGMDYSKDCGKQENLILDLVYNPNGAFLPAPQADLEKKYRRILADNFDIEFSNLLTITNLPINRFAHSLRRDMQLESYQNLLVDNFNSATVNDLMCRYLINIDWNGRVYDCDFNQMLDIPLAGDKAKYLWQINIDQLSGRLIATDRHCFGCTAGAGSSCGGALSN